MTAVEFQYSLINLEKNLMRFAYSLTDDKYDAQDLVQETFLKALMHCNRFDHESNLRAWIFTILKNTFINNYHRAILHNTHTVQTREGILPYYAQVSNADIPDSIYRTKELEKTIEGLDDDYKLPFKMHNEGFKYKEIAETLDLNIGTVKSRIFFAREKLMKQLSN